MKVKINKDGKKFIFQHVSCLLIFKEGKQYFYLLNDQCRGFRFDAVKVKMMLTL